MTSQGEEVAAPWRDAAFARSWATRDAMRDLLAFPRELAAAIVGLELEPRLVLDVGSGPGAFLQVFLEEFSSCQGCWMDASQAMQEQAEEALAHFGDRVTFRLGDMTDLRGADVPSGIDVILTSRAAHHLDGPGLDAFYAEAASYLVPGGWLVNLDHTGPADVWDRRYRAVRPRFVPPRGEPKHHHNYPLTSIDQHLHAFARAGFADVDIAWKTFYTCLFMGRSRA